MTSLYGQSQVQQQEPTSWLGRVGCFQTPASQQQQTNAPNQLVAKTYPNNTLVEDLSRCHDNLWPKVAQSTNKTIEMAGFCWLRLAHILAARLRLRRERTQVDIEQQRQRQDATQLDGGQHQANESTKADKKYRFPMPESIQKLNSTLTREDYNQALCTLTSDMRYKLHLLLFRHVQTIWTLSSSAVCVLMLALFFSMTALTTIGTCSAWLLLQAAGFMLCKRARKQLDRMLERSVAEVNSFFMDHKLMLGVINIGNLMEESRFVVPMLYFDAFQCIEQIDLMVKSDLNSIRAREADERQQDQVDGDDWETEQVEQNQIVLARSYHPLYYPPVRCRIGRDQQLAKRIVLSYSQRWISHFDRSKLLLNDDGSQPRHLSTGKCLCQFIEENLRDDNQASDTSGQAEHSDTRGVGALESGNTVDGVEFWARQARGATGNQDAIGSQKVVDVPDKTDEPILNGNNQAEGEAGSYLSKHYTSAGHQVIECQELSVASLIRDMNAKERQDSAKTSESDDLGSSFIGKLAERSSCRSEPERGADSRSSPETELSLDLESNECSGNRNEDLFRSLKLLLELRSNELSKIFDGSSMSLRNQTSSLPSKTIIPDEERGGQMPNSTARYHLDEQTTIGNDADKHASPIGQIGKKFFARVDGFFSVGWKKGHQQGFYASSSQQMLDVR